VEAKNRDALQKLSAALQRLATEDPSFRVRTDQETGQVIIAGQGELHLEVMVDRMKREDGVEVSVGKPQVAYRETVRAKATGVGDFKRQSGGRGMYGYAVIELEPGAQGTGFEFVDAIVGGAIPREFIGSVEKGILEALQTGPLSGSPVIDVKVTLVDGKYHEVDSNDMSFQIAGSFAFKDAFAKARPVILEPIMKLEVEVPEDTMGGVIGDIAQRRGRVQGTDMQNGQAVVRATVPLSETFGYSTALRNATKGQGTFNLTFSHYEEVPAHLAEEITSKGKSS
jgi:elongation factor G